MDKIKGRLKEISELKDNWDDEWAIAIPAVTINNTIKVMKDIAPLIRWLPCADILPTINWDIDISIRSKNYSILIWVDSDFPMNLWFSIIKWGRCIHWWYSKKYFKKCLHKYLITKELWQK